MSETLESATSSNSREERYRRDYDPTPEWSDVVERTEVVRVPEDDHERSLDIANTFQKGLDIEMFAQAFHQVLVPHVETVPTDYAMSVQSPDGLVRTELVLPEERAAVYDDAARLIGELTLRRDEDDDEAYLERASNIVALAIVLAHPYANGNGRTARYIGGLLREGPQSEDLKVLGAERPESGFRISSYIPREKSMTPADVLRAAAALDIPLNDTATYKAESQQAFFTPFV